MFIMVIVCLIKINILMSSFNVGWVVWVGWVGVLFWWFRRERKWGWGGKGVIFERG